jgi:NitT/TauT family transport system ATP-binding protein
LNDAHPAGGSGLLEVGIGRKAYRTASGERLEVLRDVAVSLAPGEVGALVGPSGCGKTTMLRIIAGLDQDYDGKIQRPPDGRIGMVFQEPRLLPWRTVEDNVRLVAPQADDHELATLFDVLELAVHRAHYPGELSLGLARRVALARAFAVNPALLLLDEPFVSLDDALAARLRDELAMLVDRRRITTLLVTHDVDEAVRLADRVFLLSSRPAHVLAAVTISRPRSARTASDIATTKREIADRLTFAGSASSSFADAGASPPTR